MAQQSRYKSVDMNPILLPSRLWSRSLPADAWEAPESWGERRAPVRADHFAKQAAGVCELYSVCLARATPIPAGHGTIALRAVEPDTEGFQPGYSEPYPRTSDIATARLDPALLDLPPETRPSAYLNWLQPVLLGLAATRGVSAAGFHEAYDATLAEGCLMSWEGPGRSSPDRRHRATPHYAIDAQGDAWLRVVIRSRDGTPVAEGGPWESDLRPYRWRRHARTLTWPTPAEVSIEAFLTTTADAWGVEQRHTLTVHPHGVDR
ncbi:hypothetical protein [Cryptosporangium arvum]|uniref:Uncharacterized protein n=1 Tax=Cryptosporangium arvum DSM 44712 TaxID=927661 RepID=A0A010ZSU2_9ACTN|nr:hypothetical protein [Cryptosporangium arvum]EXG80267.1 hypothetical protein CryarDRAFT_1333 [Cryptosporangium arvum DSM 44712]